MIDGGTIIAALVAVQGVVSGVTVFSTKKIISTAIKGLSARLDTEREDRLRVEDKLWSAANTHGHKGLKGDSNKVTR